MHPAGHKYTRSPLQLEKAWAYTITSVWPLETATSPALRLELRPIISSGSAALSGCSVPETQVALVDQRVPGGYHCSRSPQWWSVTVWPRSVCNQVGSVDLNPGNPQESIDLCQKLCWATGKSAESSSIFREALAGHLPLDAHLLLQNCPPLLLNTSLPKSR